MKRFVSVLMASLMLLISVCLTGCEQSTGSADSTESSVVTITNSDGNVETMTTSDLVDIYNNNEAKFDMLYKNNEVTVEGVVDRVETGNDITFGYVYKVYLVDGWELILLKSAHPEVIDLNAGDKVRIESELKYYSVVFELCYILGGTAGHTDKSTIEVIG